MITKTEMSLNEALDTITGYEEAAIEQRFGHMPEQLLVRKPTSALRAVAFVVIARDLKASEVKDPEGKAYKRSMEMTIKDVGDFFPDEEDEPIPDEPKTPAGEDDSSAD